MHVRGTVTCIGEVLLHTCERYCYIYVRGTVTYM